MTLADAEGALLERILRDRPVLLPAAQLELLNDVADFLKAVNVPLLFALVVRNDL